MSLQTSAASLPSKSISCARRLVPRPVVVDVTMRPGGILAKTYCSGTNRNSHS
jgi:hypothetical protein